MAHAHDGENPDAVSPSVSEQDELSCKWFCIYGAERVYGGPEEGGWYWSRMTPHVALPASIALEMLNDYAERRRLAATHKHPLDCWTGGRVTLAEMREALFFKVYRLDDDSRTARIKRLAADWIWDTFGARVSRPNSVPDYSDQRSNNVPEFWSASPYAARHVWLLDDEPFGSAKTRTEPWS